MTGEELIVTLRLGDYLRLADGSGKVHRAFLDDDKRQMRICRPSMLRDRGNDELPRQWRQANEAEYAANPCGVCR